MKPVWRLRGLLKLLELKPSPALMKSIKPKLWIAYHSFARRESISLSSLCMWRSLSKAVLQTGTRVESWYSELETRRNTKDTALEQHKEESIFQHCNTNAQCPIIILESQTGWFRILAFKSPYHQSIVFKVTDEESLRISIIVSLVMALVTRRPRACYRGSSSNVGEITPSAARI